MSWLNDRLRTSAGAVMLPDAVAHQAVAVVNSGPVGGLVAARHLGAELLVARLQIGGEAGDLVRQGVALAAVVAQRDVLEAKLSSHLRELERAVVFLGSLIDQPEDAFENSQAHLVSDPKISSLIAAV